MSKTYEFEVVKVKRQRERLTDGTYRTVVIVECERPGEAESLAAEIHEDEYSRRPSYVALRCRPDQTAVLGERVTVTLP